MRTVGTSRSSTALVAWLVGTLCLATLTLWIPTYWPVALFEVSLFLLAAVTLVSQRRAPVGSYFPLYPLSFMVVWGWVQLLSGHTVNRFATERAAFQWMTWTALYYVSICLLSDRSRAQRVRIGLVWFGFALAVEAILQAYLSPGKAFGLFSTGYRDFVMGPIVYHTHYAALVETLLPVALFLTLAGRKKLSAYLGVSAVLLASLVVSASRGGLVLACAEVVAVVILWQLRKPRAGRRMAAQLAVLAAVTVVLAVIVGFETASERFQTEALMAGRLQFAISTLHMIEARPWMGWGLGCWPSVYPAFATFDPGSIVNQAHTDWLQWTAEGGLPAGLAMLALAVWACRPAIRSIWGVGVIAVLVHALFDYPFSRPAVGAWPIFMLAMVAVDRSRAGSTLFGADGRAFAAGESQGNAHAGAGR